MASLRSIVDSKAVTPLLWAASLPPVSTWTPNCTPWVGTAGGGPLYGGGSVVVVVAGSAVVVVTPGADVEVSLDVVVVSAPAGLEPAPMATSPATTTAAASATAPTRRQDRRRPAAGRAGTISGTSGKTDEDGNTNRPCPLSVTYSPRFGR